MSRALVALFCLLLSASAARAKEPTSTDAFTPMYSQISAARTEFRKQALPLLNKKVSQRYALGGQVFGLDSITATLLRADKLAGNKVSLRFKYKAGDRVRGDWYEVKAKGVGEIHIENGAPSFQANELTIHSHVKQIMSNRL